MKWPQPPRSCLTTQLFWLLNKLAWSLMCRKFWHWNGSMNFFIWFGSFLVSIMNWYPEIRFIRPFVHIPASLPNSTYLTPIRFLTIWEMASWYFCYVFSNDVCKICNLFFVFYLLLHMRFIAHMLQIVYGGVQFSNVIPFTSFLYVNVIPFLCGRYFYLFSYKWEELMVLWDCIYDEN